MDPDPYSLSLLSITSFSEFFATFWVDFLVLFILLILSAVVSGTELAYFSLSQAEAEEFKAENGRPWDLLKKPKTLLATLIIWANFVNVGIIIYSTVTLQNIGEQMGWADDPSGWGPIILKVLEIGVITFILLFFGEITPKVYASRHRIRIVRNMAILLYVLRTLFQPLTWVLINSTRFLDNRIGQDAESTSYEDIKHAIDLTSEEESPEEEKEILKGIVSFSSISAKNIMRARVDIAAVEIGTPFEELLKLVNENGYSRMPVYEGTVDKIKGVLYVKDLLPLLRENNLHAGWHTLLRPAYFIPESKKLDDLLEEFKAKRLHIAIVVDEFGGTSGLVTLEDIIEQIFGEINDEFDDDELVFSKLSDRVWVFDGKMPLADLIEELALPEGIFDETKGDADSLAGLILETHGKIPVKGDVITLDGFRFTIESASRNRIKRVKMELPEPEHEKESLHED